MALNLDGTGPITGVSRLTGDTSSGDLILQADPTGVEADSIIGLEVDGSEKARIDSSGKVGIGTESPNTKLTVASNAFSGAETPHLQLLNTSAGVGTTSSLEFIAGGTGTDNTRKARIQALSGTSSSSNLTFWTTADGAALNERMRINSDGNVGIGTTNPSTALHVLRTTGDASIQAETTFTGGDARLNLYGDSGGISQIRLGDQDIANVGSITYFHTTDALTFRVNASERMRISSAGRIYLGPNGASNTITQGATFIPASQNRSVLYQGTDSAGTLQLYYTNAVAVGSITTTASSTNFNETSDYRLKENIVPLTNAIARLNQLSVHRFNFLADPDTTVDGFIAHEAQAVVPEAVTGEKDAVDEEGNPEYQGIDKSKLVPLLTAALQEALAEIESLKARVTALEP